jgi:hypothetical protein
LKGLDGPDRRDNIGHEVSEKGPKNKQRTALAKARAEKAPQVVAEYIDDGRKILKKLPLRLYP